MNPARSEANRDRSECAEPRAGDRAPTIRATPDGFEQRLLARARRQQFERGECLIVAFSGGRDSLALGAALRQVQTSLGIDPLLVHVDHRLRPSSAEEAEHAADLAAALGLRFRTRSLQAPPTQLHPHLGIEEAARRERYRLLVLAASEAGARTIATAHHQGDQAETVLLHLLRGSGLHGAAGMSERSPAPLAPVTAPEVASDISRESDDTGQSWRPSLWRPLLEESRQVIDDYVARLGLRWIEDSSNDDLSLGRNRVRHGILPLLEQHFPGATAALGRYARLAAADDEALDQFAAAAILNAVDPGGRLTASALTGNRRGLQRRMVRHWLADLTGWTGFTAERTDAVIDLAESGSGERVIEIGEHWTVRLERGMLKLHGPGNGDEEKR